MRLLLSFSPPPVTTNSNSTNSALLFARNIIIVIAVTFFVCGLLHLLVRFLMKRKRSSNNSHFHASGVVDGDGDDDDDAYDRQLRQLRQLFNLHDSGLDQAFIYALPVFSYKELMGLKEPFDCAVCLCEFTQHDNLRLLPLCSHAFHMHCIDTWLLSNSSCLLCRGTLFSPGFSVENPVFEFNEGQECDDDQGYSGHFKEGGIGNEKRVYPVRLGKFRATNVVKRDEKEMGETSSTNSNFDARRCYSMGSYEYVVGSSELKLHLFLVRVVLVGVVLVIKISQNLIKIKGISNRSKGESFSVSKIWLWSKKDHQQKGQMSSDKQKTQ